MDVNKDGRLDIIFGRGHDVGLYWREQQPAPPGGTTAWKEHVIDESWSQAHALALADLDGDGESELVAGKCIWAHEGGDPGAADPPAVYYYAWSRASSRFTRHTIAGPDEHIALGRQYSVVDLNGDRRLDLGRPERAGAVGLHQRGISRCGRRQQPAVNQRVHPARTVSSRPVPRSCTVMRSLVARTSATPAKAGGTSVRKIWNVVESRCRAPIQR